MVQFFINLFIAYVLCVFGLVLITLVSAIKHKEKQPICGLVVALPILIYALLSLIGVI